MSQCQRVTTMLFRRWPVTAVLATALACAEAASADERPAPSDEPPPTAVQSRPIRESADRLVRKLEEDAKAPCRKVAEGVPCFPVSIEQGRPEWTVSVRDSLGDLVSPGKPSPNRPPTQEEIKVFRPGPLGVIPLATFDPGCVGKSVLKRLKGKNDTYYLYRLRDVHGERIALYGHRLEPTAFQGDLEFLGRFDGECEALAAYRHEDRKAVVRP